MTTINIDRAIRELLEIMPDQALRFLARKWATRALDALPLGAVDPRSRAAVEMAARYDRGEVTDNQMDGALTDAGLAAANTAAESAAQAALLAASYDRDPVVVASRVASRVAVDWDTDRRRQLDDITALLPVPQEGTQEAEALDSAARAAGYSSYRDTVATRFWRVTNAVSGADLGVYPGDSAEEALEGMARSAGYASWSLVCEVAPVADRELRVTPL